MPTYTYRCKRCQITHSHTHGLNDNPCPPCPVCGSFSERLPSQGPAVLKHGRYGTDNKPEAPKSTATADNAGSACVMHQHGPDCNHAH